jgi:hypothetical protein
LSVGFIEGEPLQPAATKINTKKSRKRVTRGNLPQNRPPPRS